jgi:hypothetical protein
MYSNLNTDVLRCDNIETYYDVCKNNDVFEKISDTEAVHPYFDVDFSAKNNPYVEFDESYEPLFIEWGKSYINVMFQQFNISPPEFSPELCVLTSSSPSYICSKEGIEKWKVSVHIIVTNCLLYKHELKEMVKCLNTFLDNNADYYLQYSNYMWEKFFDESVYFPNQKLRACYAFKRGENRPMKLVEGTFKDSIVANVDGDK